MSRQPIQVEGLAELQRSMRRLDSALPTQLRLALNEAAQAVVDRAAPQIPVRTGAAKRSLKAASTRLSARARAGSKRAPYYPWLDFGGRVGPSNSVHRPFRREGRYIYPAFNFMRNSGQLEDILTDAIQRATRRAGLDLTSGN